jgi:multiple sugar transport system ATP-binding protein
VRHPQVFLFDEPLSNLDAKLRVQMRVELKKLHARLGTTAIYVTHDQVEAMTLGDRVVVMHEGLIQQVGEPLELYNTPANKYVAGFIGSPAMNFARVRIESSDGGLRAVSEGMRIDVPAHLRAAVEPQLGQQVWLGIRPEDLHTAKDHHPAGACFIAGVEVAEQLGSEILLDVRCGDASMVASVEPSLKVRAGDQVKLAVDPQRLHFFDLQSEKALR